MQLVTSDVHENILADEQKIAKATDTVVSIRGETMSGLTQVPTEEVRGCARGIGNQSVIDAAQDGQASGL